MSLSVDSNFYEVALPFIEEAIRCEASYEPVFPYLQPAFQQQGMLQVADRAIKIIFHKDVHEARQFCCDTFHSIDLINCIEALTDKRLQLQEFKSTLLFMTIPDLDEKRNLHDFIAEEIRLISGRNNILYYDATCSGTANSEKILNISQKVSHRVLDILNNYKGEKKFLQDIEVFQSPNLKYGMFLAMNEMTARRLEFQKQLNLLGARLANLQ